jgi:hypothetical protein
MGFEKIAENKIRQAMADGEFDRLPRRGAIDLEEYFKLPAELRLAYSVLKSAGCVPEEVALLKEIARLEATLAAEVDPSARACAARTLADTRLRLALTLERSHRK